MAQMHERTMAWSTWNFKVIGGSKRNLRLFSLSGPNQLIGWSPQPWEGIIYRESNGTKTHWNCCISHQKPHRRQVNRQRSSGRDLFIENSLVFLN